MSDRESFKATPQIRQFADILMPEDAESPILSDLVQQSIYEWLVELQVEEDLARVGLKARRSCLLWGPPGTGKTTLGHHMAARLGLPLVLVRMARLTSCYFGESSKNIDKVFSEIGNQSDSCVLFLDEFDAIGGSRDSGVNSHAERNNMVIAILQGMDQFRGTIFAATNRHDALDAAIWRRFGLHIEIGEPGDEQRFAIIKRYLSPYELADEGVDILTEVMAGASPALIREMMENLKRRMVLAPRLNKRLPTDARSIFRQLTLTVRPHAGATQPPLWKDAWSLDKVGKMGWPPALPSEKPEDQQDAVE